MNAIFKRELRSYFHGMLGYLLTAFLLASSGIYFLALNLGYGLTDFSYYTLYRTIFMLLLYIPVLTMRSLAEERRSRTDQLLLTSPVSVWGAVLGKFFAMCAVFALPCLADAVMILILWALGGTVTALAENFAGLLCYFLLGCAAIAVREGMHIDEVEVGNACLEQGVEFAACDKGEQIFNQGRNLRRIRRDIDDSFAFDHIDRNGSEALHRFIGSAAGGNACDVDEGLRCNGVFQMFKHIQQRLIVVLDHMLGFVGWPFILPDDPTCLCF